MMVSWGINTCISALKTLKIEQNDLHTLLNLA